ncbi:MAG TPA: transposase [Flavipsychrobacter sp.]|nr:transposase [Flavipsychrobacter sp.]
MIVVGSLNFCAEKYKADILGYVFMPNHLHLIIYFREDNHLSDLMRDFKKLTSV